ncbi:MAG: hypothetical protein K9H26_18380 [Prolixibacteraceae bacterium]|nr:hypothetical protein [Prolixibacteraceae bacterium]
MKRSDFPKVLLGCPINVVKDYCMDQWLDMIKNLDYPNYDVYLVDNTKNKDYHKNLRQKHHLSIDWIDPANKEARLYMAESIEKIRQRAVKHDYDYLFILEVDVFPPSEIIQILMGHNVDVCGTTYWTGHEYESFLQLLFLQQAEEEIYVASFVQWSEARKFFNGKLNTAFANGNGCILISNYVFRQIKFRVADNDGGHADSFFHKDIYMLKIANFIDTTIVPFHWNSRWSSMPDDENHAELWNKIKQENTIKKGINYKL